MRPAVRWSHREAAQAPMGRYRILPARRPVTSVGKAAFRRGNGLVAGSSEIEEARIPAIEPRRGSGVDQRLVTRYT